MPKFNLPKASKLISATVHYRLLASGPLSGIQCLTCGKTSWNPNDVANKYCGKCHRFHGDDSPKLRQPK